jgi:hypothetical protein
MNWWNVQDFLEFTGKNPLQSFSLFIMGTNNSKYTFNDSYNVDGWNAKTVTEWLAANGFSKYSS